ncbi:A89 [Sulfolobus spindle-shaped virus Lassen]|nr:A89 [Sulfolobus spindle-shaped virus Lassen]
MIEEEVKRILQKNGLKVEKVVILPSDDTNAKYIKKYEGFVRLTEIYTGVAVVEGIQIPFIAQYLGGKVHVYLYPGKDFYLSHLVGELNG